MSTEATWKPERPLDATWLFAQVGSARVGFPVDLVDEIDEVPESIPVPLAPPHLLGLASLRGEIVPLVALSVFLGLAPVEDCEQGTPDGRRRAVVVRHGEYLAAMCCEAVFGIVEVDVDQLRAPGLVRGGRIQEFSQAEVDSAHGLVALVDTPAILHATRLQS